MNHFMCPLGVPQIVNRVLSKGKGNQQDKSCAPPGRDNCTGATRRQINKELTFGVLVRTQVEENIIRSRGCFNEFVGQKGSGCC